MMPPVGFHRTIRVGGLLTVFLFIMNASISATLDHLATSPEQSQLSVYSPAGREVAVFHGNLAQLQAAEASLPRPVSELHRTRVLVVQRDYRLL